VSSDLLVLKTQRIKYSNIYGCETWSLNSSDKRKIEKAEMRFLRHVTEYTRRDEISNLTICSELNILNINVKIKEK
jgi:hypothetical protein